MILTVSFSDNYIESFKEIEKTYANLNKYVAKLNRADILGPVIDKISDGINETVQSVKDVKDGVINGINKPVENKDKSKILKHSKKHSNRKNLKLSLFVEKIFPSASSLSTKYAILRKAPVLLPFIWIVRIADALLFRRKKIKDSHCKIHNLEEKNLLEYEKALEKVGLNYSFK